MKPYDDQRVTSAAYELTLGPEAFITSSEPKTKRKLDLGESLRIPPGQFGILLTEEVVNPGFGDWLHRHKVLYQTTWPRECVWIPM